MSPVIHLRRITSNSKYIPQVDGLRFVAIASVLFFHIYGHLVFGGGVVRGGISDAGLLDRLAKRGVELFFVISGFVVALPFAAHSLSNGPRVKLKDYFLRRVTRLEPPYFVNLLLTYCLWSLALHQSAMARLPHLLASLFYSHQIVYGQPSSISGVVWSLEVEIQFYLIAPVLVLVLNIKSMYWRRALLTLAILTTGFASEGLIYRPAQLSLLYYINFFLAGILFCDIYSISGRFWKPALAWDVVSAAAWPLVWILGRSTSHVLMPCLMVILCITAFRGKLTRAVLGTGAITIIGGMCYSIYLYHWQALAVIFRLSRSLHIGNGFLSYLTLQCLIIFPFIIAVSTIFFVLIERPCMDKAWPVKLWGRLGLPLRSPPENRALQPDVASASKDA